MSVQLSDHARLRWTMRSGQLGTNLTTAWEEAVPIRDHGDIDAAEIRYHEPTETLLIRQNSQLTTVLRASWAEPGVQVAVEEVRSRT